MKSHFSDREKPPVTFVKVTEEGLSITADTSAFGEEHLAEGLKVLIEKRGFDTRNVSCGVTIGPDFGYFDLADRFWRASLCIYFCGVTRCF